MNGSLFIHTLYFFCVFYSVYMYRLPNVRLSVQIRPIAHMIYTYICIHVQSIHIHVQTICDIGPIAYMNGSLYIYTLYFSPAVYTYIHYKKRKKNIVYICIDSHCTHEGQCIHIYTIFFFVFYSVYMYRLPKKINSICMYRFPNKKQRGTTTTRTTNRSDVYIFTCVCMHLWNQNTPNKNAHKMTRNNNNWTANGGEIGICIYDSCHI